MKFQLFVIKQDFIRLKIIDMNTLLGLILNFLFIYMILNWIKTDLRLQNLTFCLENLRGKIEWIEVTKSQYKDMVSPSIPLLDFWRTVIKNFMEKFNELKWLNLCQKICLVCQFRGGISFPKNLVHLWQKTIFLQEKSNSKSMKSFCSEKSRTLLRVSEMPLGQFFSWIFKEPPETILMIKFNEVRWLNLNQKTCFA